MGSSSPLQLHNTYNHNSNSSINNHHHHHSISQMTPVTGRRKLLLMEVINGQLRVGTGMNMRIRHSSNLRIIVMMIDEVATEDEVVAEDLEEGSEVVEVVETIRMDTVVVMVVTMVATEEVAAATMTVVVMDIEAREVVVVVSEVKMDQVVDLEVDEVVKEVTVVMDIAEGSREAVGNSINNNHI